MVMFVASESSRSLQSHEIDLADHTAQQVEMCPERRKRLKTERTFFLRTMASIMDVLDVGGKVADSDEEDSTVSYTGGEVMDDYPPLDLSENVSLSRLGSIHETAMDVAQLYTMVFAGPFLACFLVLISFATFHWHDSREDTSTWWVCMITCATVWVILSAFLIFEFFNSAVYIPTKGTPISYKHLLLLIIIGCAILISLWSLSEFLGWKYGIRAPLPFVGPLSAATTFLLMVAFCTCYVPSYFYSFVLNGFVMILSIIIYWGCIVIFGLVPKYWQEFSVIPFLIVGSIVERVLTSAMAYLNDDMHMAARIYQIVNADVVKLTLISTTNSFLATLVAILFEMLVFACKAWMVLYPDRFFYIRNFRYPKSDSERYKIRISLLQNISCRDVVEIAVPPAFMICFLLVYSSKNSEVFSAVGRQEMGFEQITPSAFYYLMIYWAFDNGMLFMLSQLCNYKIKISMQKDIIMPMYEKYGKVIILFTAFPLYTMYCVLNVNCGMDFTFRFPWTSED